MSYISCSLPCLPAAPTAAWSDYMVKGLATMGTGNVSTVLNDSTEIGLATVWSGNKVLATALSISKETGLVAAWSGNISVATVLNDSIDIGLATT